MTPPLAAEHDKLPSFLARWSVYHCWQSCQWDVPKSLFAAVMMPAAGAYNKTHDRVRLPPEYGGEIRAEHRACEPLVVTFSKR